eukprot:9544471-Lingulodinium_polyedra.AAC.1
MSTHARCTFPFPPLLPLAQRAPPCPPSLPKTNLHRRAADPLHAPLQRDANRPYPSPAPNWKPTRSTRDGHADH